MADPAVGNVPAEYISISNGGDDAICVAGITVTFPSGDKSAWTGDIAAACPDTGAFIFASSNPIVGSDPQGNQQSRQNPHCVWIDRNGSGGIPHQGFGIHLPDFGNEVTAAQTDAYLENKKLMCQSGPRFRMYPQLRAETPILKFDSPLVYDEEGKDVDPSKVINNPGVLTDQDMVALRSACASDNRLPGCSLLPNNTFVPIIDKRVSRLRDGQRGRHHPRHYPAQPESTPEEANNSTTTTDEMWSTSIPTPTSIGLSSSSTGASENNPDITNVKHSFHGHLVVSTQDYHSAKYLCDHPNSYGPSFASVPEGMYCDMVEKKLYPICDADSGNSCCFDTDKMELQSCSITNESSDLGHNVTIFGALELAGSSPPSAAFTQVYHW